MDRTNGTTDSFSDAEDRYGDFFEYLHRYEVEPTTEALRVIRDHFFEPRHVDHSEEVAYYRSSEWTAVTRDQPQSSATARTSRR